MRGAWLTVKPGVNMTTVLDGKRLTKKWLREYLKDHPTHDFRNETFGVGGRYVNGIDAVNYDLTLEVHDNQGRSVAVVNFNLDGGHPVAVVR